MERPAAAAAANTADTSIVLVTLAAGQFLMMFDASVMNVSIATVAHDLGTTVTGIQTAITLYTLVMAMFMVTGGKIGAIVDQAARGGRQQACAQWLGNDAGEPAWSGSVLRTRGLEAPAVEHSELGMEVESSDSRSSARAKVGHGRRADVTGGG